MSDGANGRDRADVPPGPTGEGADEATDEAIGPTLADVLDDLTRDYPDVEQVATPDGVDYLVGAQPFACLSSVTAHFRLRPEIVAAAARTGDATVSAMGPEWVAFKPKALDQYALDRAQSWFELGHRLAAEAAAGPRRH